MRCSRFGFFEGLRRQVVTCLRPRLTMFLLSVVVIPVGSSQHQATPPTSGFITRAAATVQDETEGRELLKLNPGDKERLWEEIGLLLK